MKKNIVKKIICILAIFSIAFTTVSIANTTNASAETRVVWQQSRWTECCYYSTMYYNVTFKTIFSPDQVQAAYVEILTDNNTVLCKYTAKYLSNEQCYKALVGQWNYATKYRMVVETVSLTGKQQTFYSEMSF